MRTPEDGARAGNNFYRIPYCVPAWGWREHWAILRCLLTGHLVAGSDKERLFADIAGETGVGHVFGFGSGQDAILAVLQADHIGAGDLVVLPSYCCESVVQAVLRCGADPLFCEIGEDLNLDAHHALSLVNEAVKALIVPHLFGRPAAIDVVEKGLENMGRRGQVLVIDDAAQSFGAKLKGRLLGTFGDAGVISFGPGKTMTAAGGGLVVTRSASLAQRISTMSPRGVARREKMASLLYWIIFRRWRAYTLPLYPLFQRLLGSRLSHHEHPADLANIDAAIGRAQLHRLRNLLAVRMHRKELLDRHFSRLPGMVGAPENQDMMEVCTKYVALIESEVSPVAKVMEQFYRKNRIEMRPLYQPVHHKKPLWQQGSALPRTESIWRRIVQVPVEPSIKETQWLRLVSDLMGTLSAALAVSSCAAGQSGGMVNDANA